jgi:hypothetical protein
LKFAVKENPDFAPAWSALGSFYFKTQKYDKSIECFEKCVELEPNNPEKWKSLSLVYERKRNFSKSLECLYKAKELNPDDPMIDKMIQSRKAQEKEYANETGWMDNNERVEPSSNIGVELLNETQLTRKEKRTQIIKPIMKNVCLRLIFHNSDGNVPVQKSQIPELNKSIEDLIQEGVSNMYSRYVYRPVLLNKGNLKVFVIGPNSPYGYIRLLNPDTMVGLIGKFGAIIGIPNSRSTFICPINNMQDYIGAQSEVYPLIYAVHKTESDKLSKNLYWYYNREFIWHPSVGDDKNSKNPPELDALIREMLMGEVTRNMPEEMKGFLGDIMGEMGNNNINNRTRERRNSDFFDPPKRCFRCGAYLDGDTCFECGQRQ